LEAITALDAFCQLRDRGRLVAGRREVGDDPERLVAGRKFGHPAHSTCERAFGG
jgi:hypothetical protein